MIVQPIERNVQVSDAQHRQRATMLASPEMLRRAILPYSKLELAAVRETLNNAADASTKLAIQVPTKLEPLVRIRDFGPGIPTSQVYNFYSVAGYSTKTQTNTTYDADGNAIHVMGCKGVGRFAPLAVTDQFTFHNYTEGRCIVGQVFIDREGYPTVDILDDSPSTEPTGVEISFAVDPTKVGAIRQAFHECLVNFPAHYQIEYLGEPLDITPPQPKVYGNGWYFTDQPGVIMGRIKYEIDASEFIGLTIKTYNDLYHMIQHGVVLTVPLGSIDVNDARESIVYNDRTKAAIISAATQAVAEYQTKLDLAFAACTTPWEAAKLYNEMTNNESRNIFGTPKFAGKPVRGYTEFQIPESNVVSVSSGNGRRRRKQPTDTDLPLWMVARSRASKDYGYHIFPARTLVVLVDDPKHYIQRLAAYVNDPNSTWPKVSGHMTTKRDYERTVVYIHDPAKAQQVLDAMGGAPIHLKISDLPAFTPAPRAPRGPRTSVTIRPYVYNSTHDTFRNDVPTPDVNDASVVWMKWGDRLAFADSDPVKHPTFASIASLSASYITQAGSMLRLLREIGAPTPSAVVALTKTFQAKANKTKWRYAFDVLEEAFVAHLAKPEVKRGYALFKASYSDSDINSFGRSQSRANDILAALSLPDVLLSGLIVHSSDVPDEWTDTTFVQQVKDKLADRPLFRYLADNHRTPIDVLVSYLKEGK